MKLFLYKFILLLLAIQLTKAKTSKGSVITSSDDLTPKKQLMIFYRTEFNLLAGEICVKLKHITEEILKHLPEQSSATPLVQEFKENLTSFKHFYPYYTRFGLNESLATTFSSMVSDFYELKDFNSNESLLIKKSLQEFGYDALRQEYKVILKDFFSEKFQKKFEELKQDISSKSQLQAFEKRFSKCFEQAKECEDYECLLTNFRTTTLKLKDKFMGNIQRKMLNINIWVLVEVDNFNQNVIRHPKFSRLRRSFQEDLMKKAENTGNGFQMIKNLIVMFHLSAPNLVEDFKTQFQSELTKKQLQLINEIFEDCDFSKVTSSYEKNLGRFLQNDFIDEIENFKASFEQEGSPEDKPLMEMVESLNRESSMRERALALMALNIQDIKELKKWRL